MEGKCQPLDYQIESLCVDSSPLVALNLKGMCN